MDFTFIKFIALLILSPFFLFLFHIICIWVLQKLKIFIPLQKLIVYCIAIFNIPVFLCYLFIMLKNFNLIDYLYLFVVFNSFAYFYFHFFNMSETARRIKILVGIRNNNIKKVEDLSKYYKYDNSLEIRLRRLEELNQISKINGKYILKRKLLFKVSFLILIFRYILGFEKNNKG